MSDFWLRELGAWTAVFVICAAEYLAGVWYFRDWRWAWR